MPASRRPPTVTDTAPATAIGTVASSTGRTAVIEVDAEVCSRCASGQGCGAGLLASGAPTVSMTVPVADGFRVSAGDRVLLTLAPGSLMRAVLCLYGVPLAGLLIGAYSGLLAGVADGLAAALAAAGLAGGVLFGRWIARRDPCLSTLRPSISGRADLTGQQARGEGGAK